MDDSHGNLLCYPNKSLFSPASFQIEQSKNAMSKSLNLYGSK